MANKGEGGDRVQANNVWTWGFFVRFLDLPGFQKPWEDKIDSNIIYFTFSTRHYMNLLYSQFGTGLWDTRKLVP